MDTMAESRKKLHEIEEKQKSGNKSTKKIKNFFFGCCKNK